MIWNIMPNASDISLSQAKNLTGNSEDWNSWLKTHSLKEAERASKRRSF